MPPQAMGVVSWTVARPWRRFRREVAAGLVWFAALAVAALATGAGLWILAPLALAAAYVLGPLLLPSRVGLEAGGVRRRSPIGERFLPWAECAGFSEGRGGRVVYLHRGGGLAGRVAGGLTLFLPEEPGLKAAALDRLSRELPRFPAERRTAT